MTKCKRCNQSGTQYHPKRPGQLFSATGLLDFIAISNQTSLPKTKQSNHNIYITVNQNCKQTAIYPMWGTSSTYMSSNFLNHWIGQFGISTYPLSDYWLQIESKFFILVRKHLGVKQLMTMAYCSQTDGQAEGGYRTIITCTRYYIV